MRTYQLILIVFAIVVAGCARQGSGSTIPLDIDASRFAVSAKQRRSKRSTFSMGSTAPTLPLD